jgi:hypothetical protein
MSATNQLPGPKSKLHKTIFLKYVMALLEKIKPLLGDTYENLNSLVVFFLKD